VLTYTLPDDPYTPLMAQRGGPGSGMLTPEQVARATVDAAELHVLPLRIPIGDASKQILAARRSAQADAPFTPTPFDW
jgi:hypothetical protein